MRSVITYYFSFILVAILLSGYLSGTPVMNEKWIEFEHEDSEYDLSIGKRERRITVNDKYLSAGKLESNIVTTCAVLAQDLYKSPYLPIDIIIKTRRIRI